MQDNFENEIDKFLQSTQEIDPAKNSTFTSKFRAKQGISRLVLKINAQRYKAIELFFITIPALGQVPYVKITKANGEKKIYFCGEKAKISDLYKRMIQGNAIAASEFIVFGMKFGTEEFDWSKISKETVYRLSKNDIGRFYQKSHQQMREVLSKRNTAKKVLIISAACGDGQEFEVLKGFNKDKEICLAGFDINQENIAIASKKHPEGNFFVGDIRNINAHIARIQKSFEDICSNEMTTVIIFSGILQRSIFSGTYEAVRYLQVACRTANLVLVASFHTTLLNSQIAKKIGFDIQQQNIDFELSKQPYKNVLYELVRPNDQQRLSYLLKQSDKYSLVKDQTSIDLSLSANVLKDLALIPIDRLLKTKQLDLSWSYLEPSEVTALIDFINTKMPNLRVIMTSTEEPWYNEFLSLIASNLKSNCIICKRKDNSRLGEVPHLSISAARFFNYFENGKIPYDITQTIKPKNFS